MGQSIHQNEPRVWVCWTVHERGRDGAQTNVPAARRGRTKCTSAVDADTCTQNGVQAEIV